MQVCEGLIGGRYVCTSRRCDLKLYRLCEMYEGGVRDVCMLVRA